MLKWSEYVNVCVNCEVFFSVFFFCSFSVFLSEIIVIFVTKQFQTKVSSSCLFFLVCFSFSSCLSYIRSLAEIWKSLIFPTVACLSFPFVA